MYQVLGSQRNRVIVEDMEHEIIYIMDASNSLRIIENYKETYTNADNIPPRIMMELVTCMLENMRTLDVSDEDKSIVDKLSKQAKFARKLIDGGPM